ncbi:MAG TPA: hypothetical protein VNJ04_05225 [Gemmatimonadaceae bacterium]|nr:hypothetical protein [Gemmatimonadaceae bacterium]
MKDAVIQGRTVVIGVTHDFTEQQFATLKNIADAGGTTVTRVVRALAALGWEAWGAGAEGAMDLLYETAAAEGAELATELFDAIFDWGEWTRPATFDGFMREAVANLSDYVTDSDKEILIAVARECVAGRGAAARLKATPLLDACWGVKTWDVGVNGWRDE